MGQLSSCGDGVPGTGRHVKSGNYELQLQKLLAEKTLQLIHPFPNLRLNLIFG